MFYTNEADSLSRQCSTNNPNQPFMFAQSFNASRRSGSLLAASLFAFTLIFTACKSTDSGVTLPTPQTITQLITSNNRFTLLTAAMNRAGLSTTLSGAGPFTVFAPSDDAFRAAGFADVAAINAAPVATLTNILQYHVVSDRLAASSIPAGQTAKPTAVSANSALYVSRIASTPGAAVSVNGARLVQTDVQASNGVLHIIDRLLSPPMGTVLAIARADTSLSILVALAERGGADVTTALTGTMPLTVFAPTNAAFRAAGVSDTSAIRVAQVPVVTTILTNHIVPGVRAYSPTLTNKAVITTLRGGSLTITVGTGNAVAITSPGNTTTVSRITTPDINATNGVIHKIDRVLLP